MIKAIETRYAGHRFRSRTEARWAVFFDALGVEWAYEPQGFELPSGRYLPDFWLPRLNAWVEVKPAAPTRHEAELLMELGIGSRRDVAVVVGAPDPRFDQVVWHRFSTFDPEDPDMFASGRLVADERGGLWLQETAGKECALSAAADTLPASLSDATASAYVCAMWARFEHRERPARHIGAARAHLAAMATSRATTRARDEQMVRTIVACAMAHAMVQLRSVEAAIPMEERA